VIPPNESTIFLYGIVIAAVVTNIVYLYFIRKYSHKIKSIEDNKPYILHLEGQIKEYERVVRLQNLFLKNDNDTNNSTSQ
jgi:hypothetical protein